MIKFSVPSRKKERKKERKNESVKIPDTNVIDLQ